MSGFVSIESSGAGSVSSALSLSAVNSKSTAVTFDSTTATIKSTKSVLPETATATSTVTGTQTSSDAPQSKASQPPLTIYVTVTSTPSTVVETGEHVVSVARTTSDLIASSSMTTNKTSANTGVAQTKATDTTTTIRSLANDPDATSVRHASSTSSSAALNVPPSTTFITSTSSSSSFALDTTSSSTSSLPPTSTPTSAAAQAAASDANRIPAAGIAVASVMGLLALISVLFLIFRYCSPVRRRYEAWQERKLEARTYRETIEGIKISNDKLSRDGSPKPATFAGQRFYAPDEAESNRRQPEVQGTGLGLGSRLSLLRQHSPFSFGNPTSRQSQIGVAVSDPRSRDLPALPR